MNYIIQPARRGAAMETNILTAEQKREWDKNGYIILRNVFSMVEIKSLIVVVDQMYEEYLRQPNVAPNAEFDRRNVMEENDIFIELMDHAVTFPIVLEIMGHYILLGMSEVIIRPPNPEPKGILHTDGGQAMQQIRVSQSSLPLQIKIQYFLTDVEEKDSGNFTVVPGSHNRPFPEGGFKDGPYIPEAIQLRARAGDAVVFSHSLWHGFVTNRSQNPRKTLVYCYVHQCLRAFDYNNVSDGIMEKCTQRQRRLIGDIGEWKPGSYFYSPPDQVQVMKGEVGE